MLRDFGEIPYVPILAIRPAEMNALQELPEVDKDDLLAVVLVARAFGMG